MALDKSEASLVSLYEELDHLKNIEQDLALTNNAGEQTFESSFCTDGHVLPN